MGETLRGAWKPSRRTLLELLGGLSLAPALAACSSPSAPLTIASHSWPGYELMFLARQQGWLKEDSVRLVETTSVMRSLDLLHEGQVMGAALTLDEVLGARYSGLDLTIVLVFNVSAGADVLIARPEITRLDHLAGKRIGAESSALGALMLRKVLRLAGLERKDVIVVPLTVDAHKAAWDSGEIDALITFEPVATPLLNDGAARLFDSRAIPDTIFDVLAVRPESLRDQRAALRHLIAGHFLALDHLRTNPVDASYRMAGRLGLPGPEVLRAFRGLILPDRHANWRLLEAPGSRVVAVARQLAEENMGNDPPIPDSLVTAEFLQGGG